MSMHKKPLTRLEEEGLRAHGLPIGTPSQLSDVFRHGIAWAAAQGQGDVRRLREAAQKVISHVEGDLPIKGWLRDNDASRKALGDLRACLAASTGQEVEP